MKRVILFITGEYCSGDFSQSNKKEHEVKESILDTNIIKLPLLIYDMTLYRGYF
jgi:hypothetical protein